MEEDANQNPAALPPTTPDDDEIVVGHSGLHNVSNTCYLNATVQVRTRNVSLSGKSFFSFLLSRRERGSNGRRQHAAFFFSSSSSLSLSLFSVNAHHSKDKTALHIEKDAQIILSFFFLCVCLSGRRCALWNRSERIY
jgi:ubiquitin C-terminal hydrolase